MGILKFGWRHSGSLGALAGRRGERRGGGGWRGEGKGVEENSNLKTLFYMDCSFDSVKNLSSNLVLAKLLMSKYKITRIIYIHISMSEIVYMIISTQNTVC